MKIVSKIMNKIEKVLGKLPNYIVFILGAIVALIPYGWIVYILLIIGLIITYFEEKTN